MAIVADQAQPNRDQQRLLFYLPRGRWQGLRDRQVRGFRPRIVFELADQLRGTRLGVPGHELAQAVAGAVLECGHEFLHRRGLAVVAFEVEIEALAESLTPEQRLDHAYEFGALLIDRRRVKVVDLDVAVGTHRMGQRSAVLGELSGLQVAYVANALHRGRALIGAEFLVAKDRQPLLEAELKPVAAGDAIAGPVVEVLVRNHALDVGEALVAGGFRRGQHQGIVEDVEPLVLHRAHIEVGDGHDVEDVEIIFAPEALLVPTHGSLQRVHGPAATVLLAGLNVNLERNFATRGGAKFGGQVRQITANQREQVARLRIGIAPDRVVALAARADAVFDRIAVGEQDRRLAALGLDARGVGRQHVGAIEEIGDAAKTLRLALCAVNAA